MSRPPKLRPEFRARVQAIALLRDSIPTDEQLAIEGGCSKTWVKRLMIAARKKLVTLSVTNENVPCGTNISTQVESFTDESNSATL